MEAFHNGSLKRVPVIDPDTDLSYSTRKRIGAQRDLDHLPGPRSVSFAGLRFRVDHDLQYVSWMGWGLYLGFDRDMGLSLWDIRFRGERIIYEVRCTRRNHPSMQYPDPYTAQASGSSCTVWWVVQCWFPHSSSSDNIL
jgi:hypothetical protein